MSAFFEWRDAPEASFAVIGDPVTHSLSPAMHNASFKELEIPHRYVAVRVPRGEVDQALDHLRRMGYIGVNVTVPHKEEALNWCTSPDPFSSKVRAANTIRLADRACINTDAPGFLQTLDSLAFRNRTALVLGAGGSARALVTALVDTGWEVAIYNRTMERARELAEQTGARLVVTPDPAGASLILNTTSASLDGRSIPVLWDRIDPKSVAYDLMYADGLTPFLVDANRHGLFTVDGMPLLVNQGALSFEWWLGTRPPMHAMFAAIREERDQGSSLTTKVRPPEAVAIKQAAQHLAAGRMIGLPTETVYGIAADVFNEEAIKRVFDLKGRPAENPLIVHISGLGMLDKVAHNIGSEVRLLAETFWPGPFTMVLEKQPDVPDLVTGGLPTVAVRVPSHPVARKVIEEFGSPLAAPSANLFMGLSPTRAEHIARKIGEGLAMILDGGACEIGLESTVLDTTVRPFAILRPGAISRAAIEAVVGSVSQNPGPQRKSPGMYPRHYAPNTPVEIVDQLALRDGGITLDQPQNEWQIRLPSDPAGYGAGLYAALRQLDETGLLCIRIQAPPRFPEWEAVWDRLKRASS